jgi:hypothetical protein
MTVDNWQHGCSKKDSQRSEEIDNF